jgi:hypothetical protein
MACMKEMLCANIRQNLQVITQIATKYSDILGWPIKLLEMFESFKTFEDDPDCYGFLARHANHTYRNVAAGYNNLSMLLDFDSMVG